MTAGFLPRLWRVYREKRTRVFVREYPFISDAEFEIGVLTPTHRRMSRRVAFQIAWHQARNAEDCGCG